LHKIRSSFRYLSQYAENFRFEFQRSARQRMIEVEQGIVFVDLAQGIAKCPLPGAQSALYSVVLPSKRSLSASASARVWWTMPSR